jgi:hypothetical protein
MLKRNNNLRYAVLFSGMTEARSLNGLEFCYRILVERLGFSAENVYVLTYNGTLGTTDDQLDNEFAPDVWPGDGTPRRLKVSGQGNRESFRAVLDDLKSKLRQDDLLFINTTGHGGDYGDGRGPFLVAYPNRKRYWVSEFCEDIAQLPQHQSLIVLMAQCFSGGFNDAVVQASPAKQTYIASASSRYSHAIDEDLNWDSFQRLWLAGLAGHDVDGTSISHDLVALSPQSASVSEAFNYANSAPKRNIRDLATFAAHPNSAALITMAE